MTLEVFNKDSIDSDDRQYKEVRTKFPKQWLHWARKAGLAPAPRLKGRFRGHYLRGRNREWRVNCFGFFEASCPRQHFDRWANSRGAEVRALPKTEAEFLDTVQRLFEASASAR